MEANKNSSLADLCQCPTDFGFDAQYGDNVVTSLPCLAAVGIPGISNDISKGSNLDAADATSSPYIPS